MKTHRLVLVGILAVALSWCGTAQAETSPQIEPDVVYGHKDGLALTMDVLRPEREANHAGILFMVSGGWFSRWVPPEHMKPLFQPYLNEGYTVFLVRHGSSPRYTIPEAVADVRRAVRFVRNNAGRWDLDADRLGVTGMSAGGHLSLMLGTTGDDGRTDPKDALNRTPSRVAAVVALVAPTDLRGMVRDAPDSPQAYRQFPALDLPMNKAKQNSPLLKVTPDDAPALVIMGGDDKLVPARHGHLIDEAFEREKVPHKLLVLPGAGHGLAGAENRATVARESIAWFDRHLLRKSPDGGKNEPAAQEKQTNHPE